MKRIIDTETANIIGAKIKEAREKLNIEDFKDEMKNVWTTCVRQTTIDEAPMAYKPMSETIDNIGDSVDILDRIIPVYNFKA